MDYVTENFLASNIPDLTSYISKGKISEQGLEKFRTTIYSYYEVHKRIFPWRQTANAYYIVVSEIMLQQTQTERVVPKYLQFIERFPTIKDLAQASLKDVLAAWQGLGYNRRAMSLQLFAQRIMSEFLGNIPCDLQNLVSFRGIGPNTAGSICAFACNVPVVFIETNIRAVFIQLFFMHQEAIKDTEIISLVEQTLDKDNAREWYYALMDYGVMLKKQFKNPSRKSAHHTVQSKFEGSDRQLRGKIIKLLIQQNQATLKVIQEQLQYDPRIVAILSDLAKEKFITKKDSIYSLSS